MSIHFYRDDAGAVGQADDPRAEALDALDGTRDVLNEMSDLVSDAIGKLARMQDRAATGETPPDDADVAHTDKHARAALLALRHALWLARLA